MQEMQETWVQSLGWGDPLEEGWQPIPVFLLDCEGYNPLGLKELDMTEHLSMHMCICI